MNELILLALLVCGILFGMGVATWVIRNKHYKEYKVRRSIFLWGEYKKTKKGYHTEGGKHD